MRKELNIDVHDGFQPVDWSGSTVRWGFSSGWSSHGQTAAGLGPHAFTGSARRATSGALRTATWTRPSTVSVSQCTIWWVDDQVSSASNVWSYSTDGGTVWTAVTPTRPATPTLKSTVITGLSNPTDIRIRNCNAAGAGNYISPAFLGIEVAGSATGLTIHNVGVSGAALAGTNGVISGTRTTAGGTWSGLFAQWLPELVVWEFSNDAADAAYTSNATVQTDTNALLTGLAFLGADVVCIAHQDQGELNRPLTRQTELRKIYRDSTIAFGGAVLDLQARWGTVQEGVASGMIPSSGFFPAHPSAEGDKEIGSGLARLLRQVG
jgi:hypothetical protein